MYLTNISDYNGFTRTIELDVQNFDQTAKIITNNCTVKHYLDLPVYDGDGNPTGETATTHIPELNKIAIFVNDNKAQLPTGEQVDSGEVDGEGNPIMVDEYIGDYEYVANKTEAGVPSLTIFQDMMAMMDTYGKINEKCNYKF